MVICFLILIFAWSLELSGACFDSFSASFSSYDLIDYFTSFLQVKGSDTSTAESSSEAEDKGISVCEEVSVVLRLP